MTSDHACITGIKNQAPRMGNAARNTEAAVARRMSAAPSPGDQGDGGRVPGRQRPGGGPGWKPLTGGRLGGDADGGGQGQ
jgi:hypothetical protein